MTGPELRALRLSLGYSLTKLAEAMGVSVVTICRYQRGTRPIPKWFVQSINRLKGSS